MDATITLNTHAYGLSSVSGSASVRTMASADPRTPQSLTVSHTTDKKGKRRSVVEVKGNVLDTLGVAQPVRWYAVLECNPQYFTEAQKDAILLDLTAFLGDETLMDAFYAQQV